MLISKELRHKVLWTVWWWWWEFLIVTSPTTTTTVPTATTKAMRHLQNSGNK
jgi:hypothetical protein